MASTTTLRSAQDDPAPASPRRPAPEIALTAPAGTALFRSEDVLLLTVALPSMPGHQRRAAVAFAAEDRIASALEDVHVALGPEIAPGGAPGTYLAAVADHAALAGAAAAAQAGGLRLLPDVLLVPVPAPGAWSVWTLGGRILVRCPDATGFATDAAAFAAFWAAAGRPQLVVYSGDAPADVTPGARGLPPARPDPLAMQFDLATGRYARTSSAARRSVVRVIAVLGFAGLCHLGLVAADGRALDRIADARGADLRAVLTASGELTSDDLDLSVTAALARRAKGPDGGFLPLLARVSEIMAGLPDRPSLRSLTYAAGDGSLSLTVEGRDLAALQVIESSLTAAHLSVVSGAATTGDGGAEAKMTIRAGGAE